MNEQLKIFTKKIIFSDVPNMELVDTTKLSIWVEENPQIISEKPFQCALQFQEVGATCHLQYETIQLFKLKCNGRIISENGVIS